MLFKLFTLFSIFAASMGASVGETGPSYVTRRHHGGGGGGSVGGAGGWAGILGGQTVTVTVTETQTQTETETEMGCEETSVDEETTTDVVEEETDDGKDSDDLNSQEHCLYLFNEMRKSQNLPLFESATDEQIACADKAAAYDAQAGYHASFGKMCTEAVSQCECLPTVGFGLQGSVPGDPLQNCINAYIAEHTQNMWPELRKGHWLAITNPIFKYVACGHDGNGFYTHNFYT